jgi:glycosyltransferase involved in cell wall biosynthesis
MIQKPLVSFVLPTRNSESTIKECLFSIKGQTYGNIEIIVVDDCSADNTELIARRLGTRFVQRKSGRAEARNIGAKMAKGEFLMSVDSDMEVSPSVTEECITMATRNDAIIIPEVSVGEGFWAGCKALEKSCYTGDDIIEAARFFRQTAFDKVGGYDPELELGEDWDLNLRFREAGYRIGRVSATITHHVGRLSLREAILRKRHYGRTLKRYQRKHPREARQQLGLIRPAFIRNRARIARDPIHGLGLLLMKGCEYGAAALASYTSSDSPSKPDV